MTDAWVEQTCPAILRFTQGGEGKALLRVGMGSEVSPTWPVYPNVPIRWTFLPDILLLQREEDSSKGPAVLHCWTSWTLTEISRAGKRQCPKTQVGFQYSARTYTWSPFEPLRPSLTGSHHGLPAFAVTVLLPGTLFFLDTISCPQICSGVTYSGGPSLTTYLK